MLKQIKPDESDDVFHVDYEGIVCYSTVNLMVLLCLLDSRVIKFHS